MSVMIGVPVKDSAVWLPRFLAQLDKLEDVSRIVFSYGASHDPTLQILKQWENETKHSTEIIPEPAMLGERTAMPRPLSAAEIALVYKDFQELIGEEGWEDETHFLLIDADIMEVPFDLIQRLKAHDKDIVAPFVWTDRAVPPQFFDVHCFRLYGYRFHPFSPPDPYDGEPFEVDSVGSCYLVKRDVFKFVEYDNPHPHLKFCENALDEGFEIWVDPSIEVLHLDAQRVGVVKTPVEVLRQRAGLPTEPFDPPPYIKRDGTIVTEEQFTTDLINAYVWGTVA